MPWQTPSVSTEQLHNTRYPDPSDNIDGIQAAHDALPASGGVIKLKAGTYLHDKTYFDGNGLKITKPVRLVGEGWSSKIKVADSATDGTDVGVRVISVNSNEVTLENFQIDGNYEQAGTIGTGRDGYNVSVGKDDNAGPANRCQMRGVYSHHGTGDGVEWFGNQGVIANCLFEENNEQHVHPRCQQLTVTGNVMRRENENAMIHLYDYDGEVVSDISIVGNSFYDTQEEAIAVDPGEGSCRRISIVGNTFHDLDRAAVDIKDQSPSADNPPKNVSVVGNTISKINDSDPAIKNSSGQNVVIANNTIRPPLGSSSIKVLSDTTVLGNDIRGSRIKIKGGEGVSVHNNSIRDSGVGIRSWVSSDMDGLSIKNNLIHDPSSYGIFFNPDKDGGTWSRPLIEGNIIRSPNTTPSNAMQFEGSESQYGNGLVLRNNETDNNGVFYRNKSVSAVHVGNSVPFLSGGKNTLEGGSSPADTAVIGPDSIIDSQFTFDWFENRTLFNGNYGVRYYKQHNQSSGNWEVAFEWENDPGAGNSVSYYWEVNKTSVFQ
jgi:hypothetical protein